MGEFYLGTLPPIDSWEEYKTDFQVNINDIAEAMQKQWPGIDARINNLLDGYPLAWDIDRSSTHIIFPGHLLDDLQTFVLNSGPSELLVDFILWYRKYVNSTQRLFFYHSSSTQYLQVKPQTTETEIMSFIDALS